MPTSYFSGSDSYQLEGTASRSGSTITVTIGVRKVWGTGYFTGSPQDWNIVIDGTNNVGTWTYDFRTQTYIGIATRSKSGLTPGAKTWAAAVDMASGIGTASVSGSITIPPSVPAAPTMGTPTRQSDTQHTINWTRNATATAPYTQQQVQRSGWSGSAWATWIGAATIETDYSSSGGQSIVDATTIANRLYKYRVAASNSAGTAYSAESILVFTTPGTPSALTAVKEASGAITLTVTQTVTFSQHTTTLEYSTNSGTTWTALTTLASNITTYSHASPPTGAAIKYRARANVNSAGAVGHGLSSGWRESTSVPLQSPPNPPSSLAPNGVAFPATSAYTFTWKHNTVDTSAQTAYEIQRREVGTTPWTTTGKITSTTQARTFAANTFVDGKQYEWQVRTWGAHATASGWSSTAVFTTSSLPSATISSPGATLAAALLTVTWAYFDAEGTAQSSWEAVLLKDDVVLETKSGSGTATSTTFATRLTDATDYEVQVRVRDGSSLLSPWSVQQFTTSFPRPPRPEVSLLWDEVQGSTQITIVNKGASVGAGGTTITARTNLALNPVAVGAGGFSSNNTATWTVTKNVAVGTAPQDITTAARSALATGAVSPAVLSMYNVDALGLASYERQIGAWMWVSSPGYTAKVGVAATPFVDIPAQTWIWVTGTVPANSYALAYIQKPAGGGNASAADNSYITGVTVFTDETPTEAIWGGRDPDDYTYSWSGTAHASTSLQRALNTLYNEVFRSTDGITWTPVAENAPLNTTISDNEVPVGEVVYYRVTGWSNLPSSSLLSEHTFEVPGIAGFWSAGPGFGVAIPLKYGHKQPPSITVGMGLAQKTLHYFAGRTYPVEFAGQAVERVGDVEFLIMSLEDKRLVEALALMPAPHLFRLPDGLFMYASIQPVSITRVDRDAYTVSFQIQEVAK